jgi:hypothetical protein
MAATRVFLDRDVLINWLAKEVEPGGFSEESLVTYGPAACSRVRSTSCRSIFWSLAQMSSPVSSLKICAASLALGKIHHRYSIELQVTL